ncbi:unnamed protein product [Cladocopium goreaui]|uniref:Transmembrane protein n=1 Tax=Cladocopium goreaui TaxID=2562237 RepID=A0A9P1GP64_9DINO|nr:unnamed protein product [Cladocopium goreaui]|mmetsp:Transcript_47668/g.103956  ORF Transcript_47668/g.103956 Transcript_47668/m.103956 type:complete len:146 (+) Transcript_47668:72-509(+)
MARGKSFGVGLCLMACLWRFGALGYLSVSTARSSVARRAGDDFDFGDTPSPAPKTASKTMSSRRTYDDDDDEDDYDDELRRDEPVDSGSVATIVSFALLAVTAIGFLVFQVNQQNAAFSGSNDSPQIKKVQAVFDTYYAEGETVQ